MEMKSFLERQYHLKENPFSSRVDPRPPMAGRKDELKRWTEAVEQHKGQKGNSLNFIVGDYGLGKTFSLYKIVEQYRDVPDVLPVYMKLLQEDKVSKFGLNFVQRIFKAVGVAKIRELFHKVDVSSIQSEFHEPSKIFQILAALKRDYNEELASLAETFLYGDRNLTKTEIAKLGIRKLMNSTEIAKDYLCAFLVLLPKAKKLSLVLAIDEVEYLFSQMRGAGLASVFNTLRDFYDLPDSPSFLEKIGRLNVHPANIIFLFGISRSGWSSIIDLERKEQRTPGPVQPLSSRRNEVIELSPLNEKETREMIEKRLRINRITGRLEDKPLIPFDEGFVDYIFKLTLGNPRNIIIRCDRVLKDGLCDEVPLLTKQYAIKVFEAHRLSTNI